MKPLQYSIAFILLISAAIPVESNNGKGKIIFKNINDELKGIIDGFSSVNNTALVELFGILQNGANVLISNATTTGLITLNDILNLKDLLGEIISSKDFALIMQLLEKKYKVEDANELRETLIGLLKRIWKNIDKLFKDDRMSESIFRFLINNENINKVITLINSDIFSVFSDSIKTIIGRT